MAEKRSTIQDMENVFALENARYLRVMARLDAAEAENRQLKSALRIYQQQAPWGGQSHEAPPLPDLDAALKAEQAHRNGVS